ncbi:probable 28S ribosomal protein S16, mitochondrial [Aethina tumida]|uniref:probable 28S ribosomal protein S16, mitochondrial n=1 Tax=Aethina tumida TaxID=116153 RepID=UPI002147B957|nr:probable 28S ribosomal protein S16, mitochondrial [Aethina tumida]XP_049817007.1 probable 28S ribosomal protein S16, mitochondrial [Aethina tumida]
MFPASGTGKFYQKSAKIIRFSRHGCTNRPFFHIVVTERRRDVNMPVIEQLGSFDPIPNQNNEKLVSLNYERIRHWIGNGAHVSTPVEQLFGLAGFFPVHPTTYQQAWRKRKLIKEEEKTQQVEEKPQDEKIS